jgi:hypothetical protein
MTPKKMPLISVVLLLVIVKLAAAQEAQYCTSLMEDVKTYAEILARAEQRRLNKPCGSCKETPESRVTRCKAATREALSRNAMVELQDEAEKACGTTFKSTCNASCQRAKQASYQAYYEEICQGQ